MINKSMERKLQKGEAVDISGCKRTREGDYILKEFVESVDYCDKEREFWIWSIGKRLSDGVIFASTSTKFYLNREFECLFLR